MEGIVQLEDLLEYLSKLRGYQGECAVRNVCAGRSRPQNQGHVPRIIQKGIQN